MGHDETEFFESDELTQFFDDEGESETGVRNSSERTNADFYNVEVEE